MDASTLIGIISELDHPDLIDSIIKLGHTLAIAGHVNIELRKSDVREVVEGMVRQGKIRVFTASTAADMAELESAFPTLGLGKSDTLLLYERVHLQGKPYCILDDRQARQAARPGAYLSRGCSDSSHFSRKGGSSAVARPAGSSKI